MIPNGYTSDAVVWRLLSRTSGASHLGLFAEIDAVTTMGSMNLIS